MIFSKAIFRAEIPIVQIFPENSRFPKKKKTNILEIFKYSKRHSQVVIRANSTYYHLYTIFRSSPSSCPKPAQSSAYAKRKPINGQPEKYNYQHWLIQVSVRCLTCPGRLC